MCVIQEKRKCPNCGKTAEFGSGISFLGDRFEQFHCYDCHYTFVTMNGKFLREGVLPDPRPEDYPEW